MFTEEVALAAMRAHAAGESVDTRLLTETLELTATADMPDEVRAKLHKITGLFLRDAGDAAGALPPLENLTLRQRITDKYLANLVTSVNSN